MGRVREPIQVYLTTAERKRLDRVAKRLGVSRSEVLRRGLEDFAERDADAAREELIREGILKPARHKYTPPPESERRPIMTLEELLKDLDEFRADREIPR